MPSLACPALYARIVAKTREREFKKDCVLKLMDLEAGPLLRDALKSKLMVVAGPDKERLSLFPLNLHFGNVPGLAVIAVALEKEICFAVMVHEHARPGDSAVCSFGFLRYSAPSRLPPSQTQKPVLQERSLLSYPLLLPGGYRASPFFQARTYSML